MHRTAAIYALLLTCALAVGGYMLVAATSDVPPATLLLSSLR